MKNKVKLTQPLQNHAPAKGGAICPECLKRIARREMLRRLQLEAFKFLIHVTAMVTAEEILRYMLATRHIL